MRLLTGALLSCFYACAIQAQTYQAAYVELNDEEPVVQHVYIHRSAGYINDEIYSLEQTESFKAQLQFLGKFPGPFRQSLDELLFQSTLKHLQRNLTVNDSTIQSFDSDLFAIWDPDFDLALRVLDKPVLIKANPYYSHCIDWDLDDIIVNDLEWDYYVTDILYKRLFQPLVYLDHHVLYPGDVIHVETSCLLDFPVFGDATWDYSILWAYRIEEITDERVYFSIERTFLDDEKFPVITDNTFWAEGSFDRENALLYDITSHEEYPLFNATIDVSIYSLTPCEEELIEEIEEEIEEELEEIEEDSIGIDD